MKLARKKRKTLLLGAFVPKAINKHVEDWVKAKPERSRALFVREAVREKLSREGIAA